MKTLYESIFDADLATKEIVFGDFYYPHSINVIGGIDHDEKDANTFYPTLQYLKSNNILKDLPQYDCNLDNIKMPSYGSFNFKNFCEKNKNSDASNLIKLFIQTILAVRISDEDLQKTTKDIKHFINTQFKKYYDKKIHFSVAPLDSDTVRIFVTGNINFCFFFVKK